MRCGTQSVDENNSAVLLGEGKVFTVGQGCLADLKRVEVHKNVINQLARETHDW
jgi:hypothetical protein